MATRERKFLESEFEGFGTQCEPTWAKKLEAMLRAYRRASVAQYQRWVDDLQSGMYINCVYCGHRYGPKDKVPASMAEVLKEHVEQCPDHPMSALKQELEGLRRTVASAPEITTQFLIDAGINAFALKLLSESLAGKKDVKTFNPVKFTYCGVVYTLAPALVAESQEVKAR